MANNDTTGMRGICKSTRTNGRSPKVYHSYIVYLMIGGKQIAHKKYYPQTPEGLAEATAYRDALYRQHGIIIRDGDFAAIKQEGNEVRPEPKSKTFHEVGVDGNTGQLKWKEGAHP